MTAAQYRCAIVLGGKTQNPPPFVQHHLDHLFGGNTVPITSPASPASLSSKPVFSVPERPGIAIYFRLAIFLRRHKVQCVLAEFGPLGLRTYRAARLAGIPTFCYFRGFDASRYLHVPRYLRGLRKMMPQLSGLVAVSEFALANLRAAGIEHPNSHVIPSGVDTEEFQPTPKDADLIVSIGRFMEKKAPQTTLRAFAAATRSFPQLRLEMAGDGPELADCIALAEELGISGKVVFHGLLKHHQTRELLRRAGVYLQHFVTAENGDTEGMPSIIQEAMACGTAIVTTRHAGIPEHVHHNVNGLLVEEHDLAGYTAALETVLHDGAARDRMGKAARRYSVQNLDYRRLYAELERQMIKVIEAR